MTDYNSFIGYDSLLAGMKDYTNNSNYMRAQDVTVKFEEDLEVEDWKSTKEKFDDGQPVIKYMDRSEGTIDYCFDSGKSYRFIIVTENMYTKYIYFYYANTWYMKEICTEFYHSICSDENECPKLEDCDLCQFYCEWKSSSDQVLISMIEEINNGDRKESTSE